MLSETIKKKLGRKSALDVYGAALYIRCVLEGGEVVVNLLCSKSRVAPLKRVTLPRLELLGAHTLAELYHVVWPILNQKVNKAYCWLDAEVALTWVTNSPHKYSDFIANRVTVIQAKTTGCIIWRHVPGKQSSRCFVARNISSNVN